MVFLQSKHCTQVKVLSPVCTHGSCRLFNSHRRFKITQTGPAVMSTEIAPHNVWPFFCFFQPSTNEACRHEGRKNGLSMLRADKAWNIQLQQPVVLCHHRVFGCSCLDSGNRTASQFNMILEQRQVCETASDKVKCQKSICCI